MKFTMLIPFVDLADERPRVDVEFIEAASEKEARDIAEELAGDARKLMDLTVEDWEDEEDFPELKGLEGADILQEYGIAFGQIEVWLGERLVWLAETPFEPTDLDPWPGTPRAPPPPPAAPHQPPPRIS